MLKSEIFGEDRLQKDFLWRRSVLIAAWFGILTGLLEGALFLLFNYVPAWLTWTMRLSNVTAEILWVAPTFNLIVYTGLAIVISVGVWLAYKLPISIKIRADDAVILIMATMLFFLVFRLPERLQRKAVLLLSLGIAVQVTRWYRVHRKQAYAIFRQSLLPIALVAGLVLGITRGIGPIIESYQISRLPELPAGQPNILVIVIDTLRADHVSAYGYDLNTTPNIDRLAREGVLFENAVAPSSWTPPSHATMFTGLSVIEHGADGANPEMGDEYSTIAEVMAKRGYRTAGFSANTLWINRPSGFARGFIHFEDYFTTVGDMIQRTFYGEELILRIWKAMQIRESIARKSAEQVNEAFLRWLDRDDSRPYFVFLNFYDVHGPYLSPEPYHTLFMSPEQREAEKDFHFSPTASGPPEKRDLMIAAYDGALNYTDKQIGELLTALKNRGLLEDTLLLITSDHGEAFGEHGLYEHGNSLYRELIHVPLIVYYPNGISTGLRVKEPVSLQNLPITITSLVTPQLDPGFTGQPWSVYWDSSPQQSGSPDIPVLSELVMRKWLPNGMAVNQGWQKSLTTDDYHLIWHDTGEVELYAYRKDPFETVNLMDHPEGQTTLSALLKQFDTYISNDVRY